MPPETPETESPEAEYEQELADSHQRIGDLYDRALQANRNPIDLLREETENFQWMRKLFGHAAIDEIFRELPTVPTDSRQAFADRMTAIAQPTIRQMFFDPDIRARREAMRHLGDTEVILTGPEAEPHLEMRIHATGLDIEMSDGRPLKTGDMVMEVSWPNTGVSPRGAKDAIQAFRTMANELERRPEIKAVITVSWMVSREKLMTKLGFHPRPDVAIDQIQKREVIDWAQKGRADKPYDRDVNPNDVQLAVIPRAEFLERYGPNSKAP